MTPALAAAMDTILRPIVKLMVWNGVNLDEIFSITSSIYKSVVHDKGADTNSASTLVSLIERGHRPTATDEELLRIGSKAISDLIGTVEFNTHRPAGETGLLQLSASYASVPDQGKAMYRSIVGKDAMDFLNQQNKILASLDRSNNPEIEGFGNNRVGVGIYHFEGYLDE